MARWQVQDAKSRLSELIDRARTEGAQTITRHSKPVAVVLSIEEYSQLRKEKPDFIDFLLNSGPKFEDLEIDRSTDTGGDIDLD